MIEKNLSISQKIVKLNCSNFNDTKENNNSNHLKRILDEVKILSQKKFKKKDQIKNQKSAKKYCSNLNLKSSKKKLNQSIIQNIAVLKINTIEKIRHNKNKSSIFYRKFEKHKSPNLVFMDLFNLSIEKNNN